MTCRIAVQPSRANAHPRHSRASRTTSRLTRALSCATSVNASARRCVSALTGTQTEDVAVPYNGAADAAASFRYAGRPFTAKDWERIELLRTACCGRPRAPRHGSAGTARCWSTGRCRRKGSARGAHCARCARCARCAPVEGRSAYASAKADRCRQVLPVGRPLRVHARRLARRERVHARVVGVVHEVRDRVEARHRARARVAAVGQP